eukprot:5000798-Amphidinium_carterae.1
MQPHEVLGVPLGAPLDVVRSAYKRAALESHPDKGGSKDTFSQISTGTHSQSGACFPSSCTPRLLYRGHFTIEQTSQAES